MQKVWSNLSFGTSLGDSKEIVEGGCYLPVGNGLSYGDAGIASKNAYRLISGKRLISFDRQYGIMEVEGGVALSDMLRIAWASGWTLPVVPGTALITVGGAVASDVHGKNHHIEGSFGNCVLSLKLNRSDMGVVDLTEDDPLFKATCGGFGCTGQIVSVKVKLKKIFVPWMLTKNESFASVEEFFSIPESKDYEHEVSWIDCLSKDGSMGRGIKMLGRDLASAEEALKPKNIPLRGKKTWPFGDGIKFVHPLAIKIFNTLHWRALSMNKQEKVKFAGDWLFPLDAITGWNGMYGKTGFFQHQVRFPKESAEGGIKETLRMISKAGEVSFLAVIKKMGEKKTKAYSTFATEGISLAMDIPNNGERTRSLIKNLCSIAEHHNGGVYPCKDALATGEQFLKGMKDWEKTWEQRDPMVKSEMFRRLFGEEK